MTVVDALKISRWVRRKAWADWVGFDTTGDLIPNERHRMTRADLVSDDWVPYSYGDIPVDGDDPHAIRVSLLELD